MYENKTEHDPNIQKHWIKFFQPLSVRVLSIADKRLFNLVFFCDCTAYRHFYSRYKNIKIGLKETIIKEIVQNQLTWYGHVQRMAEGRLPK